MPASERTLRRQLACTLTARAVVVATRADHRVDLEFTPRLCEGCAGSCLWRRVRSQRLNGFEVGKRLQPGTEVTVSITDREVLLASLLLHGMPLAAILVGAVAGTAITGNDTGTLLGALASLAVAAVCFRPLGRKLEGMTLSQLQVSPKS